MKAFTVDAAWVARAYKGLTSCGDAAVVAHGKTRDLFAVVDALGHGPDAEKSAKAARAVMVASADKSLREVFVACDAALVGMRGAVMAAIQVEGEVVHFAGIGNVDLFGPANTKRPANVAGILGRGVRGFKQYPLEVAAGDRWVLVSDGIRSRDVTKALTASRSMPPKQAAEHVLAQAGRLDDDATALVMDFALGTVPRA